MYKILKRKGKKKLNKIIKDKIQKKVIEDQSIKDKILEVADKTKDKLKKAGMTIKVTTFIDPETKEEKFGGCIELYETKSNNKLLDGINFDLGLTSDFKFMGGLSKDVTISEKEFSIGGYIDVSKLVKSKGEKVSFRVGISKIF